MSGNSSLAPNPQSLDPEVIVVLQPRTLLSDRPV